MKKKGGGVECVKFVCVGFVRISVVTTADMNIAVGY